MKNLLLTLLALALLCGATLAAPDSLACRMIDWLDVSGITLRYGDPDNSGYDEYLGTCLWDMAIGDSFLVWLPGTDWFYFINPFSQSEVETLAGFDFGPVNARGIAVKDSVWYIAGGGGVLGHIYDVDSMRIKDGVGTPGASFHYAVIRDTFLYTTSTGSYGLHCINIANPESIFINWSMDYYFGFCGFEVIDSFVFTATADEFNVDIDHWRPHWKLMIAQIHDDTSATFEHIEYFDNYHHGDIASNGEYIFHVYSQLSDFIWGVQEYTLGDSYLEIWGTDYSYAWTDYDSEGVFGVDVLNEYILAVGFEHGFSILNYSDLDSIVEVARYRDTDSIFAFTHFALKENRMFAMAHPRAGICRMYMFELDESVISGIGEPAPQTALPAALEISAWPNPFNSAVTITLDGVGAGLAPARVEIFDVNGRRIETLRPSATSLEKGGEESSPLFKGGQGGSFIWQPSSSLGSGVYLVRARVDPRSLSGGYRAESRQAEATDGGAVATKRIVYLK